MTAKEYLSRVRGQKYILQQAEKELTEIRADMLTLQAAGMAERVSGSSASDLSDKYVRIEQYFDKVMAEWDKLIDMRIEAKAMIAMMPDKTYQAVLYARYINCEEWERIAEEMKFSWRNVFYVHGKALQAFERLHRIALEKCV